MTTPSLELHERLRGKIAVEPKMTVDSAEDLALVYSPGVAEPSTAIANDPDATIDEALALAILLAVFDVLAETP